MSDGNGGGLTPGQRMANMEARLDQALKEISIERHRITNVLQVEKLHTEILTTLKDHEHRLTEIERREVAEEAVTEAMTAARKEAQSNKRWVIGSAISLGVLLLGAIGLLAQIAGRV